MAFHMQYPHRGGRYGCQRFIPIFKGFTATHLFLHRILGRRRLDDDIPQLVALTKLTRLFLVLRDMPREPQFPWYVVDQPEQGTKLQPLSTLRKLERLILVGPPGVLTPKKHWMRSFGT
jgi:hypothetical protein